MFHYCCKAQYLKKTKSENKFVELTHSIHTFLGILLVSTVAVGQFAVEWLALSLIYPTLEASIKWPALLSNRINPLFLPDFIIMLKVIVQVCFQLLISDESLATIRTLKLNPKVNLINSNDILSKIKKSVKLFKINLLLYNVRFFFENRKVHKR